MKFLPKTMTGISGLDEITMGGIPQGRPTLICGGPGCGKTLFSIEFLVNGATRFNEPGVFIAFEEKTEELTTNVASLGFDLEKLQKEKKLRLDYVRIERNEIEETGEYDLDGLFIRLEHAIDSIGAKRVVLDTIENLFAGLTNQGIIRAELRRLFLWLKEKGVTADSKFIQHVCRLVKEKAHFISEFWANASYFFIAPRVYDAEVLKKRLNDKTTDFIKELKTAFAGLPNFTAAETETVFKSVAEKLGLGAGQVMQLFRVSITGIGGGPALFEIVELLGKDEINNRLQGFITVNNL